MISIKQYAEKKGITTQAVYKQIKIHSAELGEHIVKEKGKRMLDDFACDFLESRTKENPVVIIDQENKKELERLRKRELELLEEIRQKDNIIINLQQSNNLRITEKNEVLKELTEEKEKKWWKKIWK